MKQSIYIITADAIGAAVAKSGINLIEELASNHVSGALAVPQTDVIEFMESAGQSISFVPVTPSIETSTLRNSLIQEEAAELHTATDPVEAADAIADLLYVVLGAACEWGINISPIWDEVHRSNMSKFIDGHRREDGKWMKGPSWSPPNLAPIIAKQLGTPKPDGQ